MIHGQKDPPCRSGTAERGCLLSSAWRHTSRCYAFFHHQSRAFQQFSDTNGWPSYSNGYDTLKSAFASEEKPYFNLSYWHNTEYDSLIDEAVTLEVADPKKAQELYTNAMNLLVAEECAGVFLCDVQQVSVVPKYLSGFKYNMNYPWTAFFYPLHKA